MSARSRLGRALSWSAWLSGVRAFCRPARRRRRAAQKTEEQPDRAAGGIEWTFNFDAAGARSGSPTRSSRIRRKACREQPERPVVRGLDQAGAVGEPHTGQLERVLRQGERGRRAHVRGAPTVFGGDVSSFQVGRSLVRLAVGKIRRVRRERPGLHRRTGAVHAGPRPAAVGRRRRGRQPGRLLDQRPESVSVRRDRTRQSRQPQSRGVLSRQGRPARKATRGPGCGAPTTNTPSASTRPSARRT